MKKFFGIPVVFLCFAFLFVACSDYEPETELGNASMLLTINLADDIAVPGGSVSVNYGSSRNGYADMSATVSADGKTATAKLDKYYESSSGRIKVTCTVKQSGSDTALSVRADKTSVKFDEEGATINLTEKVASTTTRYSDSQFDDGTSEFDATDTRPYLPNDENDSCTASEVVAVYTSTSTETTNLIAYPVSGGASYDGGTATETLIVAHIYLSDGTFLMTQKEINVYSADDTPDKTDYDRIYKGSYTGSPYSSGDITVTLKSYYKRSEKVHKDETTGKYVYDYYWEDFVEDVAGYMPYETDEKSFTITNGTYSIYDFSEYWEDPDTNAEKTTFTLVKAE